MEPVEPETTEVIEEKPELLRSRKNLRVFAGLGGVIVIAGIVVLALFLQQRARRDPSSMLSVDDLTLQKYDLLEREREKTKAAQLRDDPLLMRKDSESETASRLEGLLNQIEKKSGALPESPDNSQVRQEEEMIAHVMRRMPSPADVKRTLLVEEGFSGVEECHICSLRLSSVGQFGCQGNVSGGLATFDDGSTRYWGFSMTTRSEVK